MATKAEVMADPASFMTTLFVAAFDEFGTAFTAWHPAAILAELRTAFGTIPPGNYNRLMTGVMIAATDRFFKDAQVFIRSCNILSGAAATAGWDPADALECAWGITEALLLESLLYGTVEDEPFTEEIRRYLGHVLDEEGIVHPPDVLRLAIRSQAPQVDDLGDPRLAEAIRAIGGAKSDEIVERLHDGRDRLLVQIETLELDEGDASSLAARLRT
jgi:hypothetical protein